MRRPTFLVTGGTGQLGFELKRTLASLGEVSAPARSALDLADLDCVSTFVRGLRPDVIVNAAAYTAVDAAESDADIALRVNAHAPGVLAREARAMGALFVHFSTDYVFDGAKGAAHVETDATSPLNVYGRSKREGELAVLDACEYALVLRTSWLYGLRGKNFLLTIRRLADAGGPLRIVDDQTGNPTWCRCIAEGAGQILAGTPHQREERIRGNPGLYHLACSGAATWYELAREIVAQGGASSVPVEPISTADYPTPAPRPGWTELDCTKMAVTFGVRLPLWRDALTLSLEN